MYIYINSKYYEFNFNEGEEIFISYDDTMKYPQSLLLEFEIKPESSNINLRNDIIYERDNVQMSIFKNVLPYDYTFVLSYYMDHEQVSMIKKTILGINGLEEMFLNLSRVKIKSAYNFLEGQLSMNFTYTFGFSKNELESGKIKFNIHDTYYLEYLIDRFMSVIKYIMSLYGITLKES